MRILRRRIRKRQLRKMGWILISAFATLAMIAWTMAPNLAFGL